MLRSGLAAFLAVAIAIGLYASVKSYRVFGNDFPLLIQITVFIGLFLSCLLVVALGLRRVWSWLIVLGLTGAFILCRQAMIRTCLRNCTASCANHSGVWWRSYDYDSTKPLPNSTEFLDFLNALWGNNLRGSYCCPGFRRAGTKTGVVFVGGGLTLDTLRQEEVLIGFCSWKSHPPPYDHQHCVVWRWGQVNNKSQGIFERECAYTGEMIQRIDKALAQAESGRVPYSSDAVQILKYELEQRKELAKRIKNPKHEN
jgi:hypothetical protein